MDTVAMIKEVARIKRKRNEAANNIANLRSHIANLQAQLANELVDLEHWELSLDGALEDLKCK